MISEEAGRPTPDWVDYTVGYLKSHSFLTASDMTTGPAITTVDELRAYHQTYTHTPNKTQVALFFCDGNSDDMWLHMFYCNGTGDYNYFLLLNKTDSLSVIFHDLLEPFPIDTNAANLKVPLL